MKASNRSGALSLRAEPRDIAGDAFEIVAAVSGHRDHQVALATTQLLGGRRESGLLRGKPGQLLVQPLDLRVQQLGAAACEEEGHGRFDDAEAHEVVIERVVTIEACDDRSQELELVLGVDHSFVCLGEVVEVADEIVDPGLHVERFEHVAANEVVEVVDRLHRHCLMEEIQCLFGVDPESPAEGLPVVGKAVEDRHAVVAQLAAQGGEGLAWFAKVFRDRQVVVGHDVEAFRLAALRAVSGKTWTNVTQSSKLAFANAPSSTE